VKPLLTIWEVNARSVAQARHLRVFRAAFRRRVSGSGEVVSGMSCSAAWRLEYAVRGEAGFEGGEDEGVEKEERGEELREGTETSEVVDVVEDFRRVKGKEKEGRR
jgi:hypothetical protein